MRVQTRCQPASQRTHMCRLHSGPVTDDDVEQSRTQRWEKRWGTRPTLIAVVVAVAIGGVGGAAIYAATADTTHAMGGGMHGPMHGPPPPGGPATPMGGPAPDQTGVLHGEYVVADGNGGFTTRLSQTGTVDEITLSSVVVRSDDGFTQIYNFPSANAVPNPSVSPHDTVTVKATRNGSTLTLDSIDKGPSTAN
jgi:hypothetical protein